MSKCFLSYYMDLEFYSTCNVFIFILWHIIADKLVDECLHTVLGKT